MKKFLVRAVLAAFLAMSYGTFAVAGEVDVLVNKLVENGVLSPADAQIVLDDTKVAVSKELSEGKSYSVPDWAQRIKWGGDVRFRTQGDWGKSTGNGRIAEQRIRERVRGRFWLEAKVNDFTTAAARFAGGGTNPRSTNDTLDGYWQKDMVMFDQYYIRFEPSRELVKEYGKYFNDLKLWAGKFPIPFQCSELVWDSDINPTGIALQYVSPDIMTSYLPIFNLYSNIGMLWIDEQAVFNTDPLLWAYQIGAKTEPFGPLGSKVNIATTLYNFANLQNKTPAVSAGTNSRWWIGDIGGNASRNSSLLGTYKYEFNVLDLLVNIDNTRIFDFEFPYGFYGDFIYNLSCHEDNDNKGILLGGYIGKKKLKNPGDWKGRAEWRFIERNSIPDFMPDSDFYGFGTYTNATTNPNVNGLPAEGGTNGKGINLAFEYQLLKNTTLNFEYYWMKPIKSFDKRDPWNLLQIDVITKF